MKKTLLFLLTSLLIVPSLFAQANVEATNSITIGIGYNSLDSYKFGEYNGITDKGGFGVGGFTLGGSNSKDGHWSIEGNNIGVDTAGFKASYGQSGRFRFFLNGDQLPLYGMDDGRSPYSGSGTGYQTLPGNWVAASTTAGFSSLSSALLPVTIDKKRQRVTTGLTWQINKQWSLNSEYRHETKHGEDTFGAIFGSSGGNPRGALLSRPLDFETDDVSVGFAFAGEKSQYNVNYNAILFSNKDNSLRFQNAFNNPQWVTGANFSDGAFGEIALEPDTTSSQLAFSGVHRFDDGSRLSGSVITTRLQQDDNFLPYSSAIAATTALPRLDLGARVDSLVANLNYSRQLNRRLLLRLRYNLQDRDNKTPQALYLRIPGDSTDQAVALSNNARRNRIYDLNSSRFDADLSYRIGGGNRLAFGYEHEEKDRTSVDVTTTKEDTSFIKLNFAPGSKTSGWIKLSSSARKADFYDGTAPFFAGHNPDYLATLVGNEIFENDPFLRRYHLTDRDRDELSMAINFSPSENIGLSLLTRNSRDQYPDALVGLQESKRRNLALDLTYTPAADWRASVYYNIDNYDNRQTGFARRGGGSPTPFYPLTVRDAANAWRMDSEDSVHTMGVGIDWTLLDGRLLVRLDGSYADAITEIQPFSTGQSWLPFPDVTTLIKNVSLEAGYKIRDNRELKLSYFYENYQSTDWAFDGVSVDTLSNLLLLGNQSPHYSGHLLFLKYVMYLDNR